MDHLQAWQKYRKLIYSDLPADVQTVARQCVLDWFGCALAGSTEPLAAILREQFGHRSGQCSVIGSDLKLEAPTAALLNGASGHALPILHQLLHLAMQHKAIGQALQLPCQILEPG